MNFTAFIDFLDENPLLLYDFYKAFHVNAWTNQSLIINKDIKQALNDEGVVSCNNGIISIALTDYNTKG